MTNVHGGRPKNINFEKYKFVLTKQNGKYEAFCEVCKKSLKNTASLRLQAHRNICKLENEAISEEAPYNGSDGHTTITNSHVRLPDIDIEYIDCENDIAIQYNNQTVQSDLPRCSSFCSSSSTTSGKTTTSTASRTKVQPTQSKKITNFVDTVSAREIEEINNSIADFFYGCNVSLSVVESKYFKNMIQKLRPAYRTSIPSRKLLSTTLLDKSYQRCLEVTREQLADDEDKNESVILIDGWKNSSTNSKTVVSMLHVANGTRAFINAWDLSGKSENADTLADIIYESIDLADKLYKTKIYAVVSDNASVMIKMGKNVSHILWHTTCNSHTGNLLAKDLADHVLIEKVNNILKEFKHCDFEKIIVEKGGKRIKLACETRWNSYRDAFVNFLTNLQFMREIHVSAQSIKAIKPAIVKLIFDEDFIDEIKKSVELFNPICELINKCQSSETSIADAADLWLSICLPEPSPKYVEVLKARKEKALNIYLLTAFYLHPYYDNSKLSTAQLDEVEAFLFNSLYNDGIEGWDLYRKKSGFFRDLYRKGLKKPLLFWSMAEKKYPSIAKMALKLLKIPASSAQIERLFSNWSFIQPPIRNRLTFERSTKLVHIYYSLKNSENIDALNFNESEDDD